MVRRKSEYSSKWRSPRKTLKFPTMWAITNRIRITPVTAMTAFLPTEVRHRPTGVRVARLMSSLGSSSGGLRRTRPRAPASRTVRSLYRRDIGGTQTGVPSLGLRLARGRHNPPARGDVEHDGHDRGGSGESPSVQIPLRAVVFRLRRGRGLALSRPG